MSGGVSRMMADTSPQGLGQPPVADDGGMGQASARRVSDSAAAVAQFGAEEVLRRELEWRRTLAAHCKAHNTGSLHSSLDDFPPMGGVAKSPSSGLLHAVSSNTPANMHGGSTATGSSFQSATSSLQEAPPQFSNMRSIDSDAPSTTSSSRLERQQVDSICSFIFASTAFLHALQAERGCSVIYVASSTHIMGDMLECYRQKSDHRWTHLENVVSAYPDFPMLPVDDICTIRNAVDCRYVGYLDVVISYTKMVDSIVDMLTAASEPLQKAPVGPSVATLLLLQRLKEAAALQRGIVGGVLASGMFHMDWNIYLSLIKNLARMESFQAAFLLLAQPDVLHLFNERCTELPSLVAAFQSRIQTSKEATEGLLLTTAAEKWFEDNCERMSRLDDVQKLLVRNIETAARQSCKDDDLLFTLFSDLVSPSLSSNLPQVAMGNVAASTAPADLDKLNGIPRDDLKFLQEVGRGGTSTIHLALWHGQEVTVKVLDRDVVPIYAPGPAVGNFVQELNALRNLHHPSICPLYGVSMTTKEFCIVMEHMEGGSLWSKLRSAPSEINFMNTAVQIAGGLRYLHDVARLMHLDLKTPNVLLNSKGNAKISDFGVTCTGSDTPEAVDRGGTLRWMAPEVILKQPCSFSSDIYSFGLILWELLTKDIPFRGLENEDGLLSPDFERQVCGEPGLRPVIPAATPEVIAKLIKQCLHQDPNQRPSASSVLSTIELAGEQLFGVDVEFLNSQHLGAECANFSECWDSDADASDRTVAMYSGGMTSTPGSSFEAGSEIFHAHDG